GIWNRDGYGKLWWRRLALRHQWYRNDNRQPEVYQYNGVLHPVLGRGRPGYNVYSHIERQLTGYNDYPNRNYRLYTQRKLHIVTNWFERCVPSKYNSDRIWDALSMR